MNDQAKGPENEPTSRALLKLLQDRFPVLQAAKPLAIGIDKQILAEMPDLDRKLLRAALRMHTGSTRYLKATEKGTQRFDLANQAVGEVAQEHRERAAKLLAERNQRRAEQDKLRQEAEEQSRRNEKLEQLATRFSRSNQRK